MPDFTSANQSPNDSPSWLSLKSKPIKNYFRSTYKNLLVPFFFFSLFQVYRTNFISVLKLPIILVRIILIILVRAIYRLLWKNKELPSYQIKGKIESTTTQIFFARSKLTGLHICMKLWPKRQFGDGSLEDPAKQLANLVEGFAFNQRFAPGIYLGVAPVVISEEGPEKILRGGLIFKPGMHNLKPAEYVVVMRDVEKEWKLDYRLSSKRSYLRTRKGMAFLAKQVVAMHKQLEPSPEEKSDPTIIASKLSFNMKRLGQAIELYGDASMKEQYAYICNIMSKAHDNFTGYFDLRSRGEHIKRCHGDLKTTNLWVSPWKVLPRKLFALDCIDFYSDFCHIDTLSDIAMLAVDIQQVLSRLGRDDAENLRNHFLESYCEKMQEKDVFVQPLLKYYMTEKAMVCSYVSLLLDKSLDSGKSYFSIAFTLAQQLEHLLVPVIPGSTSTPEYALSTNVT